MYIRRILIVATAIILVSAAGGCHELGHLPPGQVKQVIDPPPGHGGIPPGQLKKF
jgi:hypothetical protein